jgi:hypothetical protein
MQNGLISVLNFCHQQSSHHEKPSPAAFFLLQSKSFAHQQEENNFAFRIAPIVPTSDAESSESQFVLSPCHLSKSYTGFSLPPSVAFFEPLFSPLCHPLNSAWSTEAGDKPMILSPYSASSERNR